MIDYSTSEGIQIFQQGTDVLFKESSEMFYCDPDGLMYFLKLVEDRSTILGMVNIYEITDTTDPKHTVNRNFLHNYVVLTLEQFNVHVKNYVSTQTRDAQDYTILYYCIMNFLSATGRSKITVCGSEYTINGLPVGVLLLKVIIRESYVNTQSTAAYISQQLAILDEYMQSIDSDINKFNVHVKEPIRKLQRSRQSSNDILTNLFNRYKAASDKAFVEYILMKEEEY